MRDLRPLRRLPARPPLARPQRAAGSRSSTPRRRSPGTRPASAGLQDELRPALRADRDAPRRALRQMTTEFRDPVIWTVLAVFASGIVQIIALHPARRRPREARLPARAAPSTSSPIIYTRLGAPVAVARSRDAAPGRTTTWRAIIVLLVIVRLLPALVAVRRHDGAQPALREGLGLGGLPRRRGAVPLGLTPPRRVSSRAWTGTTS